VRAAYVDAHYPRQDSEPENDSRAFHTLQQVGMVEGSGGGGATAPDSSTSHPRDVLL